MEVRRVNLANWALWTSSKFTTRVKYQFHQGFWPDQRSRNPNHPLSPPFFFLQYNHPSFVLFKLLELKLIICSTVCVTNSYYCKEVWHKNDGNVQQYIPEPPLWPGGNVAASYPAAWDQSIPCWFNLLIEIFFGGFPLNCKAKKFRLHSSLGIIRLSFIIQTIYICLRTATVSDHRCSIWPL